MSNNIDIKALSMAVNSLAIERARMMNLSFGKSGNTKRTRIYQEFGYPENLTFDEYYNAYERNAVAGAAIKRMVEGCWEDYPEVFDGEKSQDSKGETPWDKATKKLLKRCWKQIKDADRRNLVGRYSALLIQLRDNAQWSDPIVATTIGSLKEKALVRLIPVWESQLDVSDWDTDPLSENYGQPKMYSYTELPVEGQHSGAPSRQVNIHPDRVIILAEGSEDGTLTSGVPLLRAGFNKLLDIEKTSGGAAEGFLKNASRQLNYEFDKDTNFKTLAAALGVPPDSLADGLDEQVKRLNNSTDSAAFMQSGKATVLSVTPGDPEPTWRTLVNEFCSTIPMPFKVLMGMQTGERASSEDAKDWAKTRMSRRNGFLSDLIETVLARFWTVGIIDEPPSGEITISWSDLLAPSKAEKIADADKMADVAVKTQNAFGRSAIKENEIRAAAELPTLPEYEIELPPLPIGDPLTDDKQTSGPAGDTTKQGGPNSKQPPGK
ncbi:Uncharacterised protein [Yersinia intermedia]|nr:Uncharacterised protein [Yersinia intermedia]